MNRLAFSLFTVWLLAVTATAREADPQAIFTDVDHIQIADGFIPGATCFFGEHAFPVLLGQIDQTRRLPVAAATHYEQGRVVLFGHTGFVGDEFFRNNSTFCTNLLFWLAGGSKPLNQIRVAVLTEQGTADFLTTYDIKADFFREWTDAVVSDQYDVLIFNAGNIRENQVEKIDAFVKNGGSFMAGATGWGWQHGNRERDIRTDFVGNQLAAPMGLVWTDHHFPRNTEYIPAIPPHNTEFLHPKIALQTASLDIVPQGVDAGLLVAVVDLAFASVPPKYLETFPGLQQLLTRQVIPTRRNRIVVEEQPLDFLAMRIQTQQFLHSQAKGGLPEGLIIPELNAAADFPGEVPNNAQRVSRTVDINTAIPDWHSTGLYAAPGDLITITIPESAAETGRLSVRIGAHSDRLWHLTRLERFPEISMTVQLTGTATNVINPFGGLVYVVAPIGAPSEIVSVQINGAVEAPYYVFDKTTDAEWVQSRQSPAPWAELASDRVILTVPSHLVRELNSPREVMIFWNAVLDHCAELAGWEGRARPERIAIDRQISVGWMHAGYPIMAQSQVERGLTDLEYLREQEAKWGFFHEFGHNHQRLGWKRTESGAWRFDSSRDWTFDGTVEVTVNLFSLYLFEKMYGIPIGESRRELFPETRKSAKERHIAAGAPFAQWQRDPFLALGMYIELIEEFGWDAIIAVLGSYQRSPLNERPWDNDNETKRDQWLVRFSNHVGRNLGPFFDQWGVPVSQGAKDSIAHLPAWLPE